MNCDAVYSMAIRTRENESELVNPGNHVPKVFPMQNYQGNIFMEQLIHKIVKELKIKISDKYELRDIRIFGSSVRGDRRKDSDIDVFVQLHQVDRRIEEDLFDIAYELELKYDCLLDLIIFSDEALKGLYSGTPIYQNILAEGKVV